MTATPATSTPVVSYFEEHEVVRTKESPWDAGGVFGDQMADARRRPKKVDRVHKGLLASAAG